MRPPRWPEDVEEQVLERYELREAPRYRFALDRREFVQVLGVGVVLCLVPRRGSAWQGRGARRAATLGQRLHVGEDGVITVLTGKVEVGQGSRTQLTAAAAEELGVPLASVRLWMGDTLQTPDDGGTSGSRTTPSTVPVVRAACAEARELLLRTAARRWQVDPGRLEVVEGVVRGPDAGQEMGYADLLSLDEAELRDHVISADVQLTKVEAWRVLGQEVARVGAVDLVTGAHRYPSDIRRPGQWYGAVLRPPSYGAQLRSVELPDSREGLVAVRDGDFVGFAAPTSFAARQARDRAAATARWEEQEHPSHEELFDLLVAGGSSGDGRQGRDRIRGNPEEGMDASEVVLRQRYHVAYVQHAPMEPRAAVAEWSDGGLTVWTGTQNPFRVRSEVAGSFRLPEERVRVIVPDTGGGFGGKHTGETAVEAARLAQAAGRPVSLQWSREEEFTWAYFRPAGVIEVAGGLDAGGSLAAWEMVNHNSGGSALESPYRVPHSRTGSRSSDAPLRQGSYRALAATANNFARECMMDELAAEVGMDPLAFRLRHLEEGRLRDVLVEATARFGWERRRAAGSPVSPPAIGLACGTEKGSFVASCAALEVDADRGRYQVREVVTAFECGAVHNPDNLRAQIEGCVIQGLGALKEEIRFAGGRILNPRFSQYPVPRFRDVPRLDTVVVHRPDLPSVGGGETPIIAVAPAVANALAAATGERIRSLPLVNDHFRPA